MDSTTQQVQEPPQPPATKASLWEDLVDVFASPAELFRRQENGSWVRPWLVLSIVMVVLYYVFLPATKAVAAAGMEEALAGATPQAAATARGAANTIQNISGIIVPGYLILVVLGVGFLLWLMGLLAKGGPRFKQAAMIVAWASFVSIIQQVLFGVLVTLKINNGQPIVPKQDASFGVLRFLDPASVPAVLDPLIGRLDIFPIWQAILWFVALRVICRWAPAKAAATSAATWILIAVPLMIGTMISQAIRG
jgi:hypothetical protein